MKHATQTLPTPRTRIEAYVGLPEDVDHEAVRADLEATIELWKTRQGLTHRVFTYVDHFTTPTPCDPIDATNSKMSTHHLLVAVDRKWIGGDLRGIAKCGVPFVADRFGADARVKRIACEECAKP